MKDQDLSETPVDGWPDKSDERDDPQDNLSNNLESERKTKSPRDFFQSFVEKELSCSGDETNTQDQFQDFTKQFVKHFIEQGGSVGTINIQNGGVNVDGNFYNSGHFTGRDTSNYSNRPEEVGQSIKEGSPSLEYSNISASERASKWFEDHPKTYHRSLMLSMAFLNGSECKSVFQLSDLIEARLQEKINLNPHEIDEESLLFKRSGFRKRLRVALASSETELDNKEYGQSSVDIAIFLDPGFQEKILKYIWQEEDYYWEIILDCLSQHDVWRSSRTKIRIANSLSESCKYRFELIREKILIPWANSDGELSRSLAALCLGITALREGGESSKQAYRLLAHWITLKKSVNLQRASIEAYSSYIGLVRIDVAFDNFLKIIKSNEFYLLPDILHGIISLSQSHELQYKDQLLILTNLEQWQLFEHSSLPNEIACLVTWGIMKTVSLESKKIFSCRIPAMLFWSNNDVEAWRMVSSLIRSSLNLKLTRHLVMEELKSWFLVVEKEESLRKILGKIITRIMLEGDDREKNRLYIYLEKWSVAGSTYALQLIDFLNKKSLVKR